LKGIAIFERGGKQRLKDRCFKAITSSSSSSNISGSQPPERVPLPRLGDRVTILQIRGFY